MAVTLQASELETLLGVNLDTATRLLNVASSLVEQYVRGSTVSGGVMNEAALRVAGYLHGQPKPGIKRESAGPLSVSYAADNTSALRHSGAMALLTSYKQRRAL